MSGTSTSPCQATALLSRGQTLLMIVIGIILWFGAALLLRYLGPMGIYQPPAIAWVYALVIPGTFPFILLVRLAGRLAGPQIITGVTIVTATALLLDGLAVAFFPSLYGATPALVAGAGGAILWGAGVGLVLGVWMGSRR